MSSSLRPKIFEFNNSRTGKNSKWPVKSPSHLRTKTMITNAKIKFSMDYDLQLTNHSKQSKNPLQNIGLAVSHDKKSSSFSICEIKDLSIIAQGVKSQRVPRGNYFNQSKKNAITAQMRKTSTQDLRPFEEIRKKSNKSLRSIVNELWNYSPIKDYNSTLTTWRTHQSFRKVLQEKYKKSEKSIRNVMEKTMENPEISQNCACVQTDDMNYVYVSP